MPAGLTFAGNGVITGTPTVPGTYQIPVTATDSRNLASSPMNFTLTVR